MASLPETQALFWRLITAPEGVAAGLRQIDMKPEELARVLGGDARLDATARLDIYANMYFYRLLDILRADHAALAAVLGDDGFHDLVTDYLLACPSTHPSVRNVGARLSQFLSGHALAAERPWLAELAALERARIEVFDAPDAEPLTMEELRARPADAFASLSLPLVPAHAFVDARFAVDDVWRAVEEGSALRPPAPEPRRFVVWRHELTIYHRPLQPLEVDAIERVRAGAPFGVVCDLVAERLPVDEAAPAAFSMLARWVGDGLIART